MTTARHVAIAAVGLALVAALAWAVLRNRRQEPPVSSGPPRFADTFDVTSFAKGNLHAHSTLSDGDSPPEEVAAWYRDHGYAFLALTEHNRRLDPDELEGEERPGFVLIEGEEITLEAQGRPVHVNAFCHDETIGGRSFESAGSALAWAIERIREQGGIALVNHPNFAWALGLEDLRRAAGAHLLEIRSGHPWVNTDGGAGRPSHEELWERLLDEGIWLAPAGVDDVHHLDAPRDDARHAGPGRAWVETFGGRVEREAICEALRHGRLYVSTGARLARIAVGGDRLAVWPVGEGARGEVVIQRGEVVATMTTARGKPIEYRLRGHERFVRVRVTMPDGGRAWTQAFRVVRGPP